MQIHPKILAASTSSIVSVDLNNSTSDTVTAKFQND